MNYFLTHKKFLLKHKTKENLIVWFNGRSGLNNFSGTVVSKNKFYKFNFFSENWIKDEFEPINKKFKNYEHKK
jgi:hypothetical protein